MQNYKNSITTSLDTLHEPLYIQLYTYYKKLIEEGTLKAGTKLPSIRRCAAERRISRTTVETAYMQLAAEGYVIAQAGSGFYVTELDYTTLQPAKEPVYLQKEMKEKIRYDFASATVDYKSFNFDVWRRYIKSALRNTDRLLSYGEAQGEYDLRVAICHYVREKRGVVCTPEQIVIGAGMQTLLHILCSLTGIQSPVIFTGSNFKQGKAVFQDRGFVTLTHGRVTSDFSYFEEKNVKMIYTSPSHATAWGDVMPMKTRLELLTFARQNQCLIIEDDYDSEFNYYSRPTPSLQGIDGGKSVVYMSTFSKLLLPSLRMSFMVLPVSLMKAYSEKGRYYNQTASKTEQIALCQFIRDGHLEKQIKKARKIYISKKDLLCQTIEKVFKERVLVKVGPGGFLVRIEVKGEKKSEELVQRAKSIGILVKACESEEEDGHAALLLSCSGVPEESFEEALELLKEGLKLE